MAEPARPFTVLQVCEHLDCSPSFVYKYREQLGGVYFGKGLLRFPRENIKRYEEKLCLELNTQRHTSDLSNEEIRECMLSSGRNVDEPEAFQLGQEIRARQQESLTTQ